MSARLDPALKPNCRRYSKANCDELVLSLGENYGSNQHQLDENQARSDERVDHSDTPVRRYRYKSLHWSGYNGSAPSHDPEDTGSKTAPED